MTKLETYVKEWMADNPEDVQYVLEHGCSDGSVDELIYFNQTTAFYNEYKDDINEILADVGMKPHEVIRNWDNEDPLALEDHNQNQLAWFGFEDVISQLGDEMNESRTLKNKSFKAFLKLNEKKLKESTTANEVLKAIEKHGGIKSFSVKDRKDRPVGCPMRRMLKQEFQKLSNEEVHIGFNLGLINTEDKA